MRRTEEQDQNRALMGRREFLQLTALSVAAAAAGCATNPVTGHRELMFYSRNDEVEMDQKASPHQFSADYGAVQDARLNAYIADVANGIAPHTHRPDMPYNYRCVNASYVNAYTFPAGSMATTRGILLQLDNEAQLAALLGHEMGHVNARHTAHAMSQNLIVLGAIAGLAILVQTQTKDETYTPLVMGLGAIGSGLLLARYSRANETQADRLGMDYIVKAGYSPDGMVGLMAMLKKLQGEKAFVLIRMFQSHPWSGDRYDQSLSRASTLHAAARGLPLNRERYMDMTAALRPLRKMADEIQKGDEEQGAERMEAARTHYANALKESPNDYESLLKMANCRLAMGATGEALSLSEQAKAVYPTEPQAWHVNGMIKVKMGRYDAGLQEFERYEQALPGNPYTVFYRGRALEGMGRQTDAADSYQRFINEQGSGSEAEYARQKLIEWGYIKVQPAATPAASSG